MDIVQYLEEAAMPLKSANSWETAMPMKSTRCRKTPMSLRGVIAIRAAFNRLQDWLVALLLGPAAHAGRLVADRDALIIGLCARPSAGPSARLPAKMPPGHLAAH